MNWKEKVCILEKNDDFDVAIFFMQKIIEENPSDVDAYIFILFRLMYCIIENSCHFANVSQTPVSEIKKEYYSAKEAYYQDLYHEYFAVGNEKFSDNPGFLFYAAHTAAMACGLSSIYAGVDEVFISNMMQKAALLDPHNMVYQWQFYPYSRDKNVDDSPLLAYVHDVLNQDSPIWRDLQSKGTFGEHLYGIMQYWATGILRGSKLIWLYERNSILRKLKIMITFKKLTVQYLPLLYTWFQEPHVKQWWPIPEAQEFFDKFLERIRSKDTVAYLAFADGVPFGYIQYYHIDPTGEKTGKWLPKLPVTTVGTDQFIGDPTYLGKGYGTAMVQAFIEHLPTIDSTITTVIVDPDPENIVAICCYKKVGFQEVGEFKTLNGRALLMRKDIRP